MLAKNSSVYYLSTHHHYIPHSVYSPASYSYSYSSRLMFSTNFFISDCVSTFGLVPINTLIAHKYIWNIITSSFFERNPMKLILGALIPHSSFLIPHSSFLIPHSSFLIPHSSFLIPHSKFHFSFSLLSPTHVLLFVAFSILMIF